MDALLITQLTNIRYLTGLTLSAGCIVATQRGATLYTDGRYAALAKTKRPMRNASLQNLYDDLPKFRRVGYEENAMTVASLERLEARVKKTKFVQSKSLLEGLRRVKDNSEIASVRSAIRITKKILRNLPSWLHAGISERELAAQIEYQAKLLGAEAMAFDTIVGFGVSTSYPHHRPSERKLSSTDIVQVDMGVKVRGYCSDMSRVFFVGCPSAEMLRVHRALVKAKKSVEHLVQSGASTRHLDRVARFHLAAEKLEQYFVHALGHGVGLDIHESPSISTKAPDQRLRRAEVVTIEPGVYIPGKWGMRIEDTIIVSD